VSTTPYASEAFLHQLLGKALAAQACDVHLKVGQPPGARVRGDMVYFRVEKIRPEDTEATARLILGGVSSMGSIGDTRRAAKIEGGGERVLAYEAGSVGRFRVTIGSAARSRWCCGACRARCPRWRSWACRPR
jgi:twitching motility protein PilT